MSAFAKTFARGSKLDALRTVIQDNTDFQEIAKTPLMLNVMSIVYQEVSLEKLTTTQFETPDTHRKYLFDAYNLLESQDKQYPNRLFHTMSTSLGIK